MKVPRLDVVFNKNLNLNPNVPSLGGDIYMTDVLDVSMQTTLDVKRDTVTLKIPNKMRRKSNGTTIYTANENYLVPNLGSAAIVASRSKFPFQEEDKISLYAYYDGEAVGSTIFDGIIFDVDYSADADNGGIYDIQLANRTQELMHSQQFANFDTQVVDQNGSPVVRHAADMIITLVNRTNQLNPNSKQISAALTTNGGYVSAINSVGGDLQGSLTGSHITYKTGYQNVYTHVQTLGGTEYTGDTASGQYLFFIDNLGRLHWGPRGTTSIGSIIESDHTKIQLNRNTDDVVNALIINAGADPNGAGILTFVIDTTSAAEVGTRFKYVPRIRIAELIQLNERKEGAILNGVNAIPNDSMFPADYPYTLQFNNIDFNGIEIDPITRIVTTDEQYKDAIRNKARKEAKEYGNGLLTIWTQARFDCSVELEFGRKTDVLGDRYNFIIPSYNIDGTINTLRLRLDRIQQDWSRNGWATTLNFKEDEITTTE